MLWTHLKIAKFGERCYIIKYNINIKLSRNRFIYYESQRMQCRFIYYKSCITFRIYKIKQKGKKEENK